MPVPVLSAPTITTVDDRNASNSPGVASGVDNICVSPSGEILIAEDGGDRGIVLLAPDGRLQPVVHIAYCGSEVAGPAVGADGSRLYFSSQRGPSVGRAANGVTFELRGPYRSIELIHSNGFETA
jgi:secreted PhoX family phosphatase